MKLSASIFQKSGPRKLVVPKTKCSRRKLEVIQDAYLHNPFCKLNGYVLSAVLAQSCFSMLVANSLSVLKKIALGNE